MGHAKEQKSGEHFYPPPSRGREVVHLPVREVVVLEDRALVRRRGKVSVEAGRSQLMLEGVAPVLQEVSLRGDSKEGKITELRVRRAMRLRGAHQPKEACALEAKLEALEDRFNQVGEERSRATQRHALVMRMLARSVVEMPQDAAFGLNNEELWREAFDSTSKRARELVDRALAHYFDESDLAEEVSRVAGERQALNHRDLDFVAWIELDIESEEARELEVSVEYIVPNALWRPLHSAWLEMNGTLRFSCRAAVWQNTGEDWQDAKLSFSTACSSLGTEPPLLEDDLLSAQRKPERIVFEQRQVGVEQAGLGHGGASDQGAVELPGVDDGGELQNLEAAAPVSVVSDGQLNIIPLFSFEVQSEERLVCMPELVPKVFRKVVQTNESGQPLLAGPVELIRESGFVGWTRVFYVAPGERFALSFGHDADLRVVRSQKNESEVDGIDGWSHNDVWVQHHLSNISGEAKAFELIERVPVSEVEHVRVEINDDECEPETPQVDEEGFCRWNIELGANGHGTVALSFRISSAPEGEL
ncbi:MAG: mucoidy inhibitor MuiA family protein [Deltaproteobacteria bacterium]|nr:mucoidy inhibitor MuiA family protein [Deltaproteobacteria bacterium]